jgi:DNA-binding CsgD family transcriptional regulator
LLDLVDQSLQIEDLKNLHGFFNLLSSKVPLDAMGGGLVPIHMTPQTLKDAWSFSISYPDEWIQTYKENGYILCDPIKRKCLSGADFQIWSDTFRETQEPQEIRFIKHARDFSISEGVTSGLIRASNGTLGFLSFAGKDLPQEPRSMILLQHLTPYIHEAMCRVSARPTANTAKAISLSIREKEVLRWTMDGKTNWEISCILAVSERTIKFHVQNAMRKLDASTRTQAVAIALGLGILGLAA